VNKDRQISLTEILALIMWMICFYHEAKADEQKKVYLRNCAEQQNHIKKGKEYEDLSANGKLVIDDIK